MIHNYVQTINEVVIGPAGSREMGDLGTWQVLNMHAVHYLNFKFKYMYFLTDQYPRQTINLMQTPLVGLGTRLCPVILSQLQCPHAPDWYSTETQVLHSSTLETAFDIG